MIADRLYAGICAIRDIFNNWFIFLNCFTNKVFAFNNFFFWCATCITTATWFFFIFHYTCCNNTIFTFYYCDNSTFFRCRFVQCSPHFTFITRVY